MYSVRTTASMVFLFFLAVALPPPLSAEFESDEEMPLSGEADTSEETPTGGETLLRGEPGEDVFFSEGPEPGGETPLSGEAEYSGGTLPGGEELFDDDYDFNLLFEAYPLIIEAAPFDGPRSYEKIFPDLSYIEKILANSESGLRHTFLKDENSRIIPAADSGIDLLGTIMKKNPSHLVEALLVIRSSEKELDILDIYNALGSISTIKDQTLFINDYYFQIFEDSTRLDNAKNRNPIEDPLPASSLPLSETLYVRLTDKYMGHLNIRGEITPSLYGITYSMTNFTDVQYFIFQLMKKESFTTIIYLEPVTEGILIYSVTGFYIPAFVSRLVNLESSMNYRITAFIKWITEGLKRQGIRNKE